MDCTPAGALTVKEPAKASVSEGEFFVPGITVSDPIAGMKLSSTSNGCPIPATIVGAAGGVGLVGMACGVSGVNGIGGISSGGSRTR